MAKSLGGWSTVRAVKEDAGGAKEATALFQKQEELRKENNKIRNMFTQNMLKTFYNSMNAFDTKQDTRISESGVLDQTYTDADGNKIQMFQRTKDASQFNPFGGKFRKLKDRVEFSDEFKELLKDPNARYEFLNDPKYQKIVSKYDTQGFVDWKAQDAKLAFQTEGFKEVQAAGGPEAYTEQRQFDTFFSNPRPDDSSKQNVTTPSKVTELEVEKAMELDDEKVIEDPVNEVMNFEDKFKIDQPDLFGALNPSNEEAVADATNPFKNQDVFDLVDKDGIIDAYTTSVNTAWDDINKIGL